jgi:hypothetical protein
MSGGAGTKLITAPFRNSKYFRCLSASYSSGYVAGLHWAATNDRYPGPLDVREGGRRENERLKMADQRPRRVAGLT